MPATVAFSADSARRMPGSEALSRQQMINGMIAMLSDHAI
jgi:hypothetical protein